jgi:hypothetical protein
MGEADSNSSRSSSTPDYQPSLNIGSLSASLLFDPKKMTFGIWKMKVMALFTSYGLIDAILTPPHEDVPSTRLSFGGVLKEGKGVSKGKGGTKKQVGDEVKARKCEHAFSILVMALQPEELGLLTSIPQGNAYAVWQMLLDHYESKTIASKINVRQQLSSCKMTDGELFDSYVSRIKQLVIKLEEMKEIVSQSELICVLYNGLPNEYESLIQALELQEDIEFDRACKFIRDKQEKILMKRGSKIKPAEKADDAAAFAGERGRGGHRGMGRGGRGGYGRGFNNSPHENGNEGKHQNNGANNRGGHANNGGNGFVRTCYTCRQPGHISINCPSNVNAKKCNNCRTVGHSTNECRRQSNNNSNNSNGRGKANNNNNNNNNNSNNNNNKAYQINDSYDERALSVKEDEKSVNAVIALDSGATRHLVNDRSLMRNIKSIEPVMLTVADNGQMAINQEGEVVIEKGNESVVLRDVGYCPDLAMNLLSVNKCTDAGATVTFDESTAKIIKKGKVMLTIPKRNKLWVMEFRKWSDVNDVEYGAAFPAIEDNLKQLIWHCRLGHMGMRGLKQLVDNNVVKDLDKMKVTIDKDHICEACIMGKAHRKSFNQGSFNEAKEIMDRLHVDLVGPVYVKSDDKRVATDYGGGVYYMGAVDEYSRKVFGTVEPYKSSATDSLMHLINRLENQTGKKLKELHSDAGGEFITTKLLDYCKSKGIVVTTTTTDTPQNNSVVERSNRTIFEMGRSKLHHAKLSHVFWGEAILGSLYIRNRALTVGNKLNVTPEQVWSGEKPSVKHLRVFGCDAYVHVPKNDRTKMEAKAHKCIHLRYDEGKRGYRVYDMEAKKIIISRDVTFNEDSFLFAKQFTSELDDATDNKYGDIGTFEELFENEIELVKRISLEEHNKEQEIKEEKVSQKVQPKEHAMRRSVRVTGVSSAPVRVEEKEEKLTEKVDKAKEEKETKAQPITKTSSNLNSNNVIEGGRNRTQVSRIGMFDYRKDVGSALVFPLIEDPKSYSEAMSGPEHEDWFKAAQEEYDSLMLNKTWVLVKAPKGVNIVGSKWVMKKKIKSDGGIERYKARLVAQGFSQQYGVDYNETYAPVVRYKSLRILLVIAVGKRYELKHLDIQTAFLNAECDDEVYMKQPQGFEVIGDDGEALVCYLMKTIYGLKQSPNKWNNKLNKFMVEELLFTRCKSDTCMYVKQSKKGNVMIMCVFVDDIVTAYDPSDESEWNEIKTCIVNEYKIRDLGDLEWILGMKVERNREECTLKLDHQLYINNMLTKFQMEGCASADTPESSIKLTKEDNVNNEQVDVKLYQSMVGALLYTSIHVRVDIAHAVNVLSRYMQCPQLDHLIAAKRVLRYLKGTADVGLVYRSGSDDGAVASAYCDADWAGDVDDRKSTSGYVVMVNGNTISWMSGKQKTVSLSTAEAEYIAVSSVVQEITWVNSMLEELSFKQTTPTAIMCDNQAAIQISDSDIHHQKTKHIAIRYHFIRDAVCSKQIKLEYVASANQLADILTKPLGKQVFIRLRNSIM